MRSFLNLTFLIIIASSVSGCKIQVNPSSEEETQELQFATTIEDLDNGRLIKIDSFPSQFVTPRGVDIWLPDAYDPSKKYAVMYLNDGQRSFTGEADRKGRELMADENATKLMEAGEIKEVILVGIHSIGRIRHSDYFPQKPFNALPQKLTDSLMRIGKAMNMNTKINSDNYLKFIVEEVKPYIDASFSTNTDFKNTFIGGTSMGGLISMYAVCEYPDVFGGAACMSTHWPGFFPSKENPIPAAFFNYMEENLPPGETHKFYFDFGNKGMDRFYVAFEDQVNAVFQSNGYNETSFVNKLIDGGNHSETYWSKRFDQPLLFLLKKD